MATSDEPVTVSDPEDLNQRHSLQEIHDARQEVRQVRWRSREGEFFDGLAVEQSNALYRTAVENYVQVLLPLLMSEEFDAGGALLEDREFGTVVCRHESPRPVGGGEVQQQEQRVVGLRSLFELPSPLVFEFEEERKTETGVGGGELVQQRKELPRHVLDKIVIACDQFRQEIGLGLDPDHGLEEYGL